MSREGVAPQEERPEVQAYGGRRAPEDQRRGELAAGPRGAFSFPTQIGLPGQGSGAWRESAAAGEGAQAESDAH
ncbi:hypothetical protein NDU88_004866 [Pleurodeles waltl]|uniref:Uncharacterized protein n=1 Tax=Pleurodeles waltl TaxID=8319 RepID=A0AAV7TSR6_PLEWA|nr:hypothetical protein NDU88_004866 [Pleurodeles waltl]